MKYVTIGFMFFSLVFFFGHSSSTTDDVVDVLPTNESWLPITDAEIFVDELSFPSFPDFKMRKDGMWGGQVDSPIVNFECDNHLLSIKEDLSLPLSSEQDHSFSSKFSDGSTIYVSCMRTGYLMITTRTSLDNSPF